MATTSSRWRVRLDRIDWANPSCGYEFPDEASAQRFAANHRTPTRPVVVCSPDELDIPDDMPPLPPLSPRRPARKPPVPVLSDEVLSLFDDALAEVERGDPGWESCGRAAARGDEKARKIGKLMADKWAADHQ